MKTKFIVIRPWATLLLLFSILNPHLTTLFAQGTAFTYQGRLNDGASFANGNYDLTFSLFPVSNDGIATTGPLTNSAVAVSNGLFTGVLDFGANAFTGPPRWLEIGVRTNGSGVFSTLAPRQPLTPTPYAIYAESASASALTGNIRTSNLSGNYNNALIFTNAGNNFAGNGGGLTNVNAAMLGGLASSNFWKATGNAGTAGGGGNFVGTTDNQPLYFKVNGLRAFMLVPGGDSAADTNSSDDLTCSVIGGCALNQLGVGVVGATIAGGGALNFDGVSYVNWVLGDYGAVGGGMGNYASNIFTVVAGGRQNRASGQYASIGGGNLNLAGDYSSTISGGDNNTASGPRSTISGGTLNVADGPFSTVGGGSDNSASATDSTVGGGENNTANSAATVAGGANNSASGFYSTVGGGINNNAGGTYSTIPGGVACTAAGDYSFAAGRRAHADFPGSFIWCDSLNQDGGAAAANTFTVRASGGVFLYTSSGFTGVQLGAGGGSWSSISDRNVKENFQPVNPLDVLSRVAAIPLNTWNYKTQDKTIRHIGPMAQDFYAAFSVGEDEKHITTVDADGVALAAIQGLNQKVEEERIASQAKDARITALEAELLKLKQKMDQLANSKN